MTHTITIPDWTPTNLNRLLGRGIKARHRAKRADAEIIGGHCLAARVPEAKGPRRVTVLIEWAKKGRAPDPDNLLKSLLDGLVACRRLVDDDAMHAKVEMPTIRRGLRHGTTITLEDIDR